MYWYVLVCTQYVPGMVLKFILSAANLRVEGMEALLLQIEGIASCTHHTPGQLRLPFHTAKCSQSTAHYMLMKNMGSTINHRIY
jgi:hypothetical protein